MGILGDMARRDLSGGRTKEKTIRPFSKYELKEIIKEEYNEQGKDLDLRHIVIPKNMPTFDSLFEDLPMESVDLTGWDTSNISRFGGMFCGCGNLKTIKGIEDWDMSKGCIFSLMFYDCKSLEFIDLSGWKIKFNDCKDEENDDIDIILHNMFYGCNKLKQIIGFENWHIPYDYLKVLKKGFCKHITEFGNIIR